MTTRSIAGRSGLAAAVLVLWGAVALDGTSAATLPKVGDPAPGFELPSLDRDAPVRLAELAGGPVFVNFWATWCPPCVAELPSIQKLAERYGPRGLTVIAISVDSEGPRTIRRFLEDKGIEVHVLLDPGGEVATRFGVFRYPESFVIDATGTIVRKYVGPHEWTEETYTRVFDDLIGAPPEAPTRAPAATP